MKQNVAWVKLAGFIAALALLLIVAPAALADGTYSYNDGLITWTYTATGAGAAITAAKPNAGTASIGTLAIPAYVPNGSTYVPVTTVGGCSWLGDIPVDKVIIPEYVTVIANSAFDDCDNIKSFDFRCSALTTINRNAFYQIPALTSIDLPDSVTYIGDSAFCRSGLESIDLPGAVTTIGNSIFSYCTHLTEATIRSGNVSSKMFEGDSSLQTLLLGGGVTGFGSGAFSGCTALKTLFLMGDLTTTASQIIATCHSISELTAAADNPYCSSVDNVLYTKDVTTLLRCGPGRPGPLTVPNTVTEILPSALQDCASLTSIILPSGLKSIGDCAFAQCYSLTGIDLPDTVTAIGAYAFQNDNALASVRLSGSLTTLAENMFINCSALTNIVIPSGVTRVGSYCFFNCGSLTSVQLSEGLTDIGEHCFDLCDALSSVNFPSGLKTIGANAFSSCAALKSVDLPDTVTTFGNGIFSACTHLTEAAIRSGNVSNNLFFNDTALQKLTIGDVTSIDSGAFVNCSAVKTLCLQARFDPIASQMLALCPSISELTVTADNPYYCAMDNILYTKDMTEFVWITPFVSGAVTVPGTVAEIPPSAFQNNVNLTSVTLLPGLKGICDYAFAGCSSLAAINLPGTVTSIGIGAFSDCKALRSIVIPGGVTSLSDRCFYKCNSLTSVQLPDGLTSIGPYCFEECRSLPSIDLPGSVTSIGDGAFVLSTALARALFQGALPTFGSSVFIGCAPGFATFYPVRYESSWASYSYTAKQAYAFVTWEPGDGSAAKTTMENVNAGRIASPAAPTRTEYVFGGWFMSPAFGAAQWNFLTGIVTDDFTLYAHWKVTIFFDGNGGSGTDLISAEEGAALTAPAAPTRVGYTFAGWNPAFPDTMPAGGLTLTAQWTVNNYAVTFDVCGGSEVAPITAEYGSTLTAPASPTREGYTFIGWQPAFPAMMPLGGAMLTAQWQVNKYTISFIPAGGSTFPPITADYGSLLHQPPDPTRYGYTFAGWVPAFPATMPAGDLTLTAQWTADGGEAPLGAMGGALMAAMPAQPQIGLRLTGGGYTTSNATVADVINGRVTFLMDGTATLEAGGTRISVKVSGGSPAELTLCEGTELTLVSEDAISWSTEDGGIAAISAGGRLTALHEGTATITGETQNGWIAEIKVLVKQPDLAPEPVPTVEPEATPEPTPSTEPVLTPEPTPSTEPVLTPEPTPSTEPDLTPEPTPFTEPDLTPGPGDTPAPGSGADPTPAPVDTGSEGSQGQCG